MRLSAPLLSDLSPVTSLIQKLGVSQGEGFEGRGHGGGGQTAGVKTVPIAEINNFEKIGFENFGDSFRKRDGKFCGGREKTANPCVPFPAPCQGRSEGDFGAERSEAPKPHFPARRASGAGRRRRGERRSSREAATPDLRRTKPRLTSEAADARVCQLRERSSNRLIMERRLLKVEYRAQCSFIVPYCLSPPWRRRTQLPSNSPSAFERSNHIARADPGEGAFVHRFQAEPSKCTSLFLFFHMITKSLDCDCLCFYCI